MTVVRKTWLVGGAALATAALAFGVLLPTASNASQDWTETWRDDFTDWSQWQADTGCGWGNGTEPQAYAPENATIADLPSGGTAGKLTVRKQAQGECEYTSARRHTAASHAFTLGDQPMRFTARLKMSEPGNGLWPAWWLYETDGAGGYCATDCHEVDIVEWIGDTPRVAELHSHRAGADSFGEQYVHDQPLGAAFHEYAVEWNGTDTLTWLFDGEPVAEQTDAAVFKGREYMLILNFALLSDDRWPPHPGVDDTTPMPSSMLVDYVKVETNQGR